MAAAGQRLTLDPVKQTEKDVNHNDSHQMAPRSKGTKHSPSSQRKRATFPHTRPSNHDEHNDDDDDRSDDVMDVIFRRINSAPIKSGKHHQSAGPTRRNTLPRDRKTSDVDNTDGATYMPTPLKPQVRLMESIAKKQILDVKTSLEAHPGLNLHLYTDNLGMSALHTAVQSGMPQIIDALLERPQNEAEKYDVIHHAILFAIQENDVKILEHLLDKQDILRKSLKTRLSQISNTGSPQKRKSHKEDAHLSEKVTRQQVFEDAEYSSDLTPLVLASHLERTDMVKLLLNKNEDDNAIHPVSKPCTKQRCCICKPHKGFKDRQSLDKSRKLLDIYKAMSSPAYLFQCGVTDPILESFQISRRIETLKEEYPAYQKSFDEIDRASRHFTWDMIDLCRDGEVEVLLSTTEGFDEVALPKRLAFPRIAMALHYNQREFLAHPSCQQLLQRAWYKGLPDYFCRGRLQTPLLALYFFLWMIGLPFLCLCYMFHLSARIRNMMQHPFNRFLSDTVSYVTFLLLIFIDASLTIEDEDDEPARLPSAVQWMIILWVMGMTLRYIKVLYRKRSGLGLWRFSNSLQDGSAASHFFDFFLLFFFCLYIVLRLIGIVAHWSERDELHRGDLGEFDPLLWSECAYVLAVIFAFARVNALLKVSSSLGPLQISLTMMFWDIFRFMVLFAITILAFVTSVTKLYAPYKSYLTRRETYATQYTSFVKTLTALFLALFNYGDVNEADVTVQDSSGSNTDHRLTHTVGYIIVGTYHVVAIIVLLNMLIAMMSHSFNTIQANCDLEWKFARTRLFIHYFSEVGALPPPYNIAPFNQLITAVRTVLGRCCKCIKLPELEEPQHKITADTGLQYTTLIQHLAKRYWRRRRHAEWVGVGGQPAGDMAARKARRHVYPSWCTPNSPKNAAADSTDV